MRRILAATLILCGACSAAPRSGPGTASVAAILSGNALPSPAPGDTAALAGTIRDTRTRAPVVGVIVRRDGPHGFGAQSDSAGTYRLEHLPIGRVRLNFYCSTRTLGLGQPLPQQVVSVHRSHAHRDLLVPTAQCTEPAPDSLRAEFRGHYRGGFELSSFVPCAAGGVSDPGFARRVEGKNIWVRTTDAARQAYRERNPSDTTRAPRVYVQGQEPVFYVRWSGVLAGPGMHGHFGVSPYGLRVESIAEFSETSPPDCPAPAHRTGP